MSNKYRILDFEFRNKHGRFSRSGLLIFLILFYCACNNNRDPVEKISRVEKACMDNVIKEDSILAIVRNEASRSKPLSQAIHEYVSGLDSVNLSSCPIKFSSTIKKHIKAWKSLIPITDKYPDLRGGMHVLFEMLKSSPDSTLFNNREKLIRSTWSEVEKWRGG